MLLHYNYILVGRNVEFIEFVANMTYLSYILGIGRVAYRNQDVV